MNRLRVIFVTPCCQARVSPGNGGCSRNMSGYFEKSPLEGCLPAPTFLRNEPKRRRQSARCDFRWKRLATLAAKQIAGKLGERVLVDLSLEIDHGVKGYPIAVPAPGIEFGALRSPQAHVALAPDQPKQEPDLLLAPVIAAPIPFEPLHGYLVAQPVARPAQDLHVGGQQAHFFPQFAVHRLHRRLPKLDPALRKLPGVFLDALAPENLVAPVAEDDADVRPIAVSIEHTPSSKKSVDAHSFTNRRRFEGEAARGCAACEFK